MFRSVGESLQNGMADAVLNSAHSSPRGRVRSGSRLKGYCEAGFWQPVSRRNARRIVLAARRFERRTMQKGRQNGALGFVAIEIIELLANLVHQQSGRLDPTITYLMRTLGRSRDAIVRALQALRRHGFLQWIRRYVSVGEGQGPKVRQTSNAYRMTMPAVAERLLGNYYLTPPLAGDEQHRRDELMTMLDTYLVSLDLRELPFHTADQDDSHELGDLNAILSRLGLAIETPRNTM